jgi:hypothetical protein
VSQILAIVLLTGANCVSPVEASDVLKVTLASKTPCAVVVREQTANPFKVAQARNTITPAAVKPAPVFKYPPKKKKHRKKRR